MRTTDTLGFTQSLASKIWSIVIGIFIVSLIGCGIGDEHGIMTGQGPTISTTATATGTTASLAWDPVNDPSILGYYIHYGKHSPNQFGSCLYDHVQFVSTPQGTVINLDFGSMYYFAVSAYNGLEGNCSNEVSTST